LLTPLRHFIAADVIAIAISRHATLPAITPLLLPPCLLSFAITPAASIATPLFHYFAITPAHTFLLPPAISHFTSYDARHYITLSSPLLLLPLAIIAIAAAANIAIAISPAIIATPLLPPPYATPSACR